MNHVNENNTESPSSAEAPSPGVRLRKAREACELSCEEVASHLKLSVGKIESLERGEVEKIAAPVFVAGYLRSYARLVNLSGDEIVADFKALAEMELPSMDPASSPAANDYGQVGKTLSLNMSLSGASGLGAALTWGVVIVLLVVGVYVFLTNGNTVSTTMNISSNSPRETDSVKNLVADVLLNKEIPNKETLNKESPEKDISNSPESIKPFLKKEVSSVKSAKAEIPAPFAEPPKDNIDKHTQSKSAVPNTGLSELTLYFTEESWVDVRDSRNERLLYRLGKAGMSHTVSGLAPFNVRLGFVNGVSIMFNGESHDLSRFANRKSARFLVGEKGDQISGG